MSYSDDWNIVPTKRVIKEPADNTPEHICIAELIDNCLDERTRAKITPPLRIDMKITRDKTSGKKVAPVVGFEMKWNMPINEEDLKALLTPGLSNNTDGTIGIWGQGAKIATHGLAREWRLTTVDNDRVIEIYIPTDWINDEHSWKVKHAERKRTTEKANETTFVALKLNELKWKDETYAGDGNYADRNLEYALSEFISSTYGKAASFMQVYLNGNEIELLDETDKEHVIQNYLFVPGYEPHIIHEAQPIIIDGERYRVSTFIGLHKVADTKSAGVYLYGNGKLFQKSYQGQKMFSRYHSEWTRIRIHMFIEGHPKFIPWGIPAKMYLREDDTRLLPALERIVDRIAKNFSEIVYTPSKQLNMYSSEADIGALLGDTEYSIEIREKMAELFETLREYYRDNWDITNPVLSDEACKDFRASLKRTLGTSDGQVSNYSSIDLHLTLLNAIRNENLSNISSELLELNKLPLPEPEDVDDNSPIRYPVQITYPLDKNNRPKENKHDFIIRGTMVSFILRSLPRGYDYEADERGRLSIVSASTGDKWEIADSRALERVGNKNNRIDYDSMASPLDTLANALGLPNGKADVYERMKSAVLKMSEDIEGYRKTGYADTKLKVILKLLGIKLDMIPQDFEDE
jgi:hypothetical protein